MTRSCTAVLLASLVCSALVATSAPAAGGGYAFPTRRERFETWAMNALGPSAVAGSLTSAAWGQWVTDEPPEWPDDDEAYLKRFRTASATTAITETSLSLLSAAFRQDPRYHRCPCAGLGPRLSAALEAKGYKVLTWSSAGWVYFFSRRPVTAPEMCRGT